MNRPKHHTIRLLSLFVVGLIVAGTVSMAAPPEPAQAQETPEYDGTVIRTDGVDGFVTSQGNPAVKARVWDIEIIGDTAYVGGKFTSVVRALDGWEKVDQPFLAAFDTESGRWVSTFRPALDGPVWALEQGPDGQLYAGGEFTMVNGQARTALVALDPVTGATDPDFLAEVERPGADKFAIVRDLDRRGSDLYVIGNFSRVAAGSTRVEAGKVVKVNATTGAINETWKPVLAGRSGWAIVVSADGKRVHLGGEFTYVNGVAGTSLYAAVDNETGKLVRRHRNGTLNPPKRQWPLGGIVFDLEVNGPLLFVAGAEHYWAVRSSRTGQPAGPGLQKGSLSAKNRLNDTQVVENLDGRIIIGCHCIRSHRFADLVVDGTTGKMLQEITYGSVAGGDGLWAAAIDKQKCYWYGGDFRGSNKVRGLEGEMTWVGNFIKLCPTSIVSVVLDGDLAVNGTARQIGTAFSGDASRAIDGKTDGVYANRSVSSTTLRKQAWWEVDLGNNYQINKIRIHNRTDCCDSRLSNFVVMISPKPMGGRTYRALIRDSAIQKIHVDSMNRRPVLNLETDFPGRYVQVRLKGGGYLHLAEVEVFGAKEKGATLMGSGADWTVSTDRVWPDNWQAKAKPAGGTWVPAKTTFGYGDGDEQTVIDSGNRPLAVVARSTFDVSNPAAYDYLSLKVAADDGASIWINGQPVAALRMPNGVIKPSTLATENVWGKDEKAVTEFLIPASVLVSGTNTIAASVHQGWPSSRDLAFDLELTGETSAPPRALDPAPTITVGSSDVQLRADVDPFVYFDGPDAPAGDWTQEAYNDSAWKPAAGTAGLGEAGIDTKLPPDRLAYYVRADVPIGNVTGLSATVNVTRDDGIIVYVNGQEIGRDNMPDGPVDQNTLASRLVWGSAERDVVSFAVPDGLLKVGNNVIAAEIHQGHVDSKDARVSISVAGSQ